MHLTLKGGRVGWSEGAGQEAGPSGPLTVQMHLQQAWYLGMMEHAGDTQQMCHTGSG